MLEASLRLSGCLRRPGPPDLLAVEPCLGFQATPQNLGEIESPLRSPKNHHVKDFKASPAVLRR